MDDRIEIIISLAVCIVAVFLTLVFAIAYDNHLKLKCYEVNKEKTAVELKLLCS